MKTKSLLLIFTLFMMCACSKTPQEKGIGYLTLNVSQSAISKSGIEIEDFTLRINDGQVDVLKKRISELPAEIELPAGTYTIEAYSIEFTDPKFDEPLYSGITTVEIEAGETSEVSLVCSQGNAGIKVVWSENFPSLYDTYYVQIYCDAETYLHYSSTEERTGYFLPGTVSVIIHADGQTINGGTITLAARDMVTAHLRPKYEDTPSGDLTIVITIDETVNEREVEITVDPNNNGNPDSDNSVTNPYNIAQAIEKQGERGVWISGYIVGSITTTSDYDFANPDKWNNTNIVLADDITETDSYKVIFVELVSGSQYRNNLNLKDKEEVLHRKVLLRGNLLIYQSRSGLRNLSGGFSFQE